MPDHAAMPPSAPPRAWQRMLSGRRLDLLAPDPADIDIADIAHGLARVARWNGQTVGEHAFSVAQHCLLVEAIAGAIAPAAGFAGTTWGRPERLAALLHDAPEYVVGDLISPFKAAIGLDYKAFERRLLEAVHRRFGLALELAPHVSATIKRADGIAAWYEATGLAGFSRDEADRYFAGPLVAPHVPPALLDQLEAWPTRAAQQAFLLRFHELWPG